MKPMAKNTLTPDDIILIIKSCAENGVSKFKLDTLKIEFGKHKVSDTVNFTEPLTQEAHDKMDKKTLAEEESRTRDEQLKMMLIENPLLAEELISNGDLEDDGIQPEDGLEADGEEFR